MARRAASNSKKPRAKRVAKKSAARPKPHRPTFASVTSKPCVCEYLENAADDPSNPIVFEEETNEYHFKYYEPGSFGLSMILIYHCPFCGGTAPRSRRDLLFHVIPHQEVQRLTDLIGAATTLEDVIRKLGQPEDDNPHGSRDSRPEEEGRPPNTQWSRTLHYTRLSDVADVWFWELPDGRARWKLVGKLR